MRVRACRRRCRWNISFFSGMWLCVSGSLLPDVSSSRLEVSEVPFDPQDNCVVPKRPETNTPFPPTCRRIPEELIYFFFFGWLSVAVINETATVSILFLPTDCLSFQGFYFFAGLEGRKLPLGLSSEGEILRNVPNDERCSSIFIVVTCILITSEFLFTHQMHLLLNT